MHRSFHELLAGCIVATTLIAPVAAAQDQRSISGDYMCDYGCRLTDAAPSVEVNGAAATCTNELGGIYYGKVLTANSIFCFNKVGTLLEDGKTIRWDDGVIWKRVTRPAY